MFGFMLMILMRWQLAWPGKAIPLIGSWFSDSAAPGGVMLPEFYNQLGAMHGTIMVFSAWCRSESVFTAIISCRFRSARPTWRFRN